MYGGGARLGKSYGKNKETFNVNGAREVKPTAIRAGQGTIDNGCDINPTQPVVARFRDRRLCSAAPRCLHHAVRCFVYH